MSDTSSTLRGPWLALAGVIVLALAGWGVWQAMVGGTAMSDPTPAPAALESASGEELRQQVATLRRSDQISRDANRALQGTLAERDEEIAGLRADVAFYERLVGATAQRRGLSVHALHLQPQAGSVWHFTGTLTQNLNRGAVTAGTLALVIEGSRNGKLETLDWAALRQQPRAAGVPFSFKYFQQVEGEVFLPPGLTPSRVTVKLVPRGAAPVEQAFTWLEATRETP